MSTDDTGLPALLLARASYFDGATSRKHHVALQFGNALEIVGQGGAIVATWPYADVRRVDGPASLLRLASLTALPLARLDIEDPATIEAVVARCPSLDAGRGPRQTWRIVGWSLAAACSIVAIAVYGIPLLADRLAPLVPVAVEQRIGDAVDANVHVFFKAKVCDEPVGQAAFNTMIEKLRTAGRVELPLKAEVLSHPLPNAFALPGGKVYLMDGLLRRANTPDEIAGVLAHELGHVHHRDGLRRLIQTGGTSFLIGLLFGDVLGGSAIIFATQSMLDASYSRDSEQDADGFAITTMQNLGRSAVPMGEFLLRVTDEFSLRALTEKARKTDAADAPPKEKKKDPGKPRSKGFTLFDSHPVTADRLTMMKKLDRPVTGPEILSPAEWKALKSICQTK